MSLYYGYKYLRELTLHRPQAVAAMWRSLG
jgi:hypothetical protein